ncbi:MAG: PAS domain S-box protein [Planctomycetota bacterium]
MPPSPSETPGRSSTAAIDLVAAVATGMSWTAALLVDPHSAWHLPLHALAGATLFALLLRPWRQRRTQRTLQASVSDAERDRRQAEANAARHAARWQAIVDTATEGIVTIDEAARIETFNGAAERLFGYQAAEVLGHNVSLLMPNPYQQEHDGYMQRYLRTGERRIIGIGREVLGRRKDGTEFPIDLSVGEGRTDGRRFFTAVIRDITERKEMQTKLAQAERLAAAGELAAGVAHEINNPINTVINCAQLVQDGDDARENCQVIIEEGKRIADIVGDLLQFARDDHDRPQATPVPEVVQRTLRMLGENWKRHGVRLSIEVPDDLPAVQARPQRLQQVLLNLLINAKDALLGVEREVRQVWLAATPRDGGVELTVRDNGPGLPEHLGARVFEPFVTTKRARGGTGLGLSISKSIVEGYGGRIVVESVPGVGATFRIWLPVAAAE